MPCCLFAGLKWPPAVVKPGASHLPTSWMWMACTPGLRFVTVTDIWTPPLVAANFAWPAYIWFSPNHELDCPVPRLTLLFFGAAKDVPEAAKMVTAGTACLHSDMQAKGQTGHSFRRRYGP